MIIRSSAVAALLVGMSALFASSASAQGRTARSGELQPGDALRITVWETQNLSGEFAVGPDGRLRHPIYSQVRVSGIPMDSVKTLLTDVLKSFQREPLFTLEPLVRFTVVGRVISPGSYLLAPEATIADAILKAGGASDRGRMDKVGVDRASGQRLTVNLVQPTTAGSEHVISGDRINVTTRRPSLVTFVPTIASLIAASASVLLVSRQRR